MNWFRKSFEKLKENSRFPLIAMQMQINSTTRQFFINSPNLLHYIIKSA